MKAGDGNWLKVKILKHMISLYGSHFPGAIVTIPEHVAENWVENGIAEWSKEPMIVPEVVEFEVLEEAWAEADVSEYVISEALPDVDESTEQPLTDTSDSQATVVEEEPVAAPVVEVVKPKKAKRVRKPRKK